MAVNYTDLYNQQNTGGAQARQDLSARLKSAGAQKGAAAGNALGYAKFGQDAAAKANLLASKGAITESQKTRMMGGAADAFSAQNPGNMNLQTFQMQTGGASKSNALKSAAPAGQGTQPAAPDLKGMSAASLLERRKAIQEATEAAKLPYQSQIDNAEKEFAPLKNEAYANDRIAQRQQRERLANMGLGATGGASMTLENNRAMSLQNRLGEISRQQQQLKDDANLQISQLVAQGKTQEAQAVADESGRLNQQLVDDYYKTKDYNMQTDQFNYQKDRDKIGDQYRESEFNAQQEVNKFNKAWELYQQKGISAKKFKNMTGIDVKALGRHRW